MSGKWRWRSSHRPASKIVIAIVRLYQRLLSPLLGERCKYYPSCSRYAVDAIRSYGVAKGSILATWRVLRCNPFSHGGVDHACDQTVFKTSDGPARFSLGRYATVLTKRVTDER